MKNMTFLESDQIFGSNSKDQLDIFKKYGVLAAISDFSICLGGCVSGADFSKDGKSLENRTGIWWTRTDDGDNDARVVSWDGSDGYYYVTHRRVGYRPAFSFSSIEEIAPNGVRGRNKFDVYEIEYGEYPQSAVSKSLQNDLESLFNRGSLKRTGKTYTTDSRRYTQYEAGFSKQEHIEYEYNGRRFVRVKVNSFFDGEDFSLSNGLKYKDGDYVFIEVEPIKWLVDEKERIALSKNILFAGVQFNKIRNYKGNFSKTDVKSFMDSYFSKEIEFNKNFVSSNTLSTLKKNPYNFLFDEVSEEDIIRGSIESNVPIFLHGKSSDGKSSRVKQLDPDYEVIYLANATPDSLNGKSVYDSNTGKMIDIPPTWFQKLEKKCKEKPEKIHILFFDEMTNAPLSIQNYAFNIVLDKEVNGIWKLPENVRIAAAGNEIEDSKSAEELTEPLFNRFAHAYIETTTENWLKWAMTDDSEYTSLDYKEDNLPMKIHPSICAYIAYKQHSGEGVLRTKYNGKTPNADPRKWEMASKVLYTTKNPEMIRSLVGEDVTKDFVYFCRQSVLSVDDVVNDNFSDNDLVMSFGEKYFTAVGLSSCSDSELEKVRNFVSSYLGAEPKALFDSLWAHDDKKRLERIMELDMSINNGNGGIAK